MSVVRWGWRGPEITLAWGGVILLFTALVDGTRPWEDAILLSLLVLTTGRGKRTAAFVLAVLLSWASQPPLQLPTYWFCLTPLVWAWRSSAPRRYWAWEAFLVGVVMCWLGTPFTRDGLPKNSLIPHLFDCSLFGVQWIAIAGGLRLTRRLPPLLRELIAAALATGCEVLQAVFGLPWIFMALALPAAPTPLAQWACFTTIFGVSFLLYLLNFLWLPDSRKVGIRRWVPSMAGTAIAALAWFGGLAIASETVVQPLPFSALLVQPQASDYSSSLYANAVNRLVPLLRLTRGALADQADVDLVVWPESSHNDIPWPEGVEGAAPAAGSGVRIPSALIDLTGNISPEHRPPLLLGVPVRTQGMRFNSACLVQPDGAIQRHDKTVLVAFSETLPRLLNSNWVREQLLPTLFGLDAPFEPGNGYRLLMFTTRSGRTVRLGVSICYEMYFPWLPQYRRAGEADALVHLTNESWVAGHSSLAQLENWVCQYRAIETRRWQLLCTTMGNSAVVDPGGHVRARLRGNPGTVRAPFGPARSDASKWDADGAGPGKGNVAR
jgi:apolipoprotein N-acyltransferase